MIWGDLHKPEIFNDREGKPQVSLELTAVSIQFSPLRKTRRIAAGARGSAGCSRSSIRHSPGKCSPEPLYERKAGCSARRDIR